MSNKKWYTDSEVSLTNISNCSGCLLVEILGHLIMMKRYIFDERMLL